MLSEDSRPYCISLIIWKSCNMISCSHKGSIHWMYWQITQYDIANLHPQSNVWQTKHSYLVSRKTTFTYLHDIGKVQTTQMIKIFKMSQVRSVLAHSLGTIERSASDAFTWEKAPTTQVRSAMAHSLGNIERSASDAFTWEKVPSLQL